VQEAPAPRNWDRVQLQQRGRPSFMIALTQVGMRHHMKKLAGSATARDLAHSGAAFLEIGIGGMRGRDCTLRLCESRRNRGSARIAPIRGRQTGRQIRSLMRAYITATPVFGELVLCEAGSEREQ